MATIVKLKSGNWRAQVRRAGLSRSATFEKKREAADWAAKVESQARHVAASGYAPPPRDATLGSLITLYVDQHAKEAGRTKAATLEMLKRELGSVKLANLNSLVMRAFVDARVAKGAGGVTIAADLSFLSAVLKWGKYVRQLDLPERLPLETRASLVHRGLSTRGKERAREPTDAELSTLYEHWRANVRQRIDMPTLCEFALASGMRLGEICNLRVEDVDREAKTVLIRDRKDPQRKDGNHHRVPLLPTAWKIVSVAIDGRETGPIFPANAASVSTAFTRACQELDIADLRFHDLRHRATAGFFRAGLDIPRVALMTGHKTWAMLRRYTDIKAEDVHDAWQHGPNGALEEATP